MVCRSRNMGLYCIDVSFLSGRRTRMARDKDGGETFKTTCKENSIRGWKTASKSLSNPPINLAPKESSALSCLSVCELFFSFPSQESKLHSLSWAGLSWLHSAFILSSHLRSLRKAHRHETNSPKPALCWGLSVLLWAEALTCAVVWKHDLFIDVGTEVVIVSRAGLRVWHLVCRLL